VIFKTEGSREVSLRLSGPVRPPIQN
jgi:hypothetical protein